MDNNQEAVFELGPKINLYGDDVLDLAMHADQLCQQYDVDIIFTAQFTDIERLAKNTTNIKVFSQHMDPDKPGAGIGKVLGEAIKYAGAQGVILNHAENPMTLMDLNATIRRADEIGLVTMVCAGKIEESAAVACLSPNIVLAESPDLIGKGKRGENDAEEIKKINKAIKSIHPEALVLHGAGITDENDVYNIILAGSDGTGSTSGVLKAANPKQMLTAMIAAVEAAYKERNKR